MNKKLPFSVERGSFLFCGACGWAATGDGARDSVQRTCMRAASAAYADMWRRVQPYTTKYAAVRFCTTKLHMIARVVAVIRIPPLNSHFCARPAAKPPFKRAKSDYSCFARENMSLQLGKIGLLPFQTEDAHAWARDRTAATSSEGCPDAWARNRKLRLPQRKRPSC
ncbi:hypothetical protein [Paenibacillus aestuarii]|uniref:Uncharacterized protein n=1 Tax=Paenibacillus aestuarii TaxID=516965 RepID=A0ABW0KBN0_9BACL|nr:hypothetical protein [Paenibacillus aestuarii]